MYKLKIQRLSKTTICYVMTVIVAILHTRQKTVHDAVIYAINKINTSDNGNFSVQQMWQNIFVKRAIINLVLQFP